MSALALMLAAPSRNIGPDPVTVIRQLQQRGDWMWEFKFDGIRAQVAVRDGVVTITNRRGRDVTYRYPDLADALDGLDVEVILDGEIVCTDEAGRPDFARAHRRDAQNSERAARQLAASLPVTLVAFDVLAVDGADLRGRSYDERRAALEGLAGALTPRKVMIPPVSGDGLMFWQVVGQMGLEGLVGKRRDSRYEGGRRTGAWVKVKRTLTASCLVIGYEPGEGSRAGTFGALTVGLYDGVDLVDVGSVGSGFTDADMRAIWPVVQQGRHLVVEVAFLEFTRDRRLRQPVFKGVRRDVTAQACVMSQITEPNG